ncbi:DUF3566 domain-containing protein [Streptomyces sp. NPDC054770]
MSRTKHSRTRSTARRRTPRISSRIVTAPTAPTPARPEPGAPQPTPTRDHTLPHAPPGGPSHLRISETNPWSVTVMSFFFLAGLGVCVLGAAFATSVTLAVAAPGEWPTPWETVVIATGVVTLEIVLGTALACLCSFMYNYTARFSGGVEVALTDDLSDPTPAARALQLMTRLHVRVRQPLRARLPVNPFAGKRLYRRRADNASPPAAETDHRPRQP